MAGGLRIGRARRHGPPGGRTLEPAPFAGAAVPKDQWQWAIGRRLLTPAEEAARARYFLGQFAAAMRRFAGHRRRSRSHPSAA
ncbi:MAG TPA: hypothetical protein VFJ30_17915 [Phycisphaerae bacterium]|nr:hypothetical protein [Phycisphaerae bacterium]